MKTLGCGTAKVIREDDLCAMALVGMTPADIAKYYGLTRQGFNKILEKNEKLSDAFHNGLHHILIKAAKVIEEELNEGKKSRLLAATIIMNNRGGWKEARYEKEKQDTIVPVNIYLPDNGRTVQTNEAE